MVDKVKPLKMENPALGGDELDMSPTEANPAEDYLNCKGIAFEDSDDMRIEAASGELGWDDEQSSGFMPFNTLKEDYLDRTNVLGFAEVYSDGSQGPFILKYDPLFIMLDATLENYSLIGLEDQS